jgi:hypothetical protein
MTEDNKLLESIVKAMHQNNGFDASRIKVSKVQGILFLKGAVSRESEKATAEKIAFSMPGVVEVVNQLSFCEDTTRHPLSKKDSTKTDIKFSALMKLTAISHIAVAEPEVSLSNGTLTLYGIVDAFWKRVYIGDIFKDKFPDLYVENALTVIPPHEGEFLAEKNKEMSPPAF